MKDKKWKDMIEKHGDKEITQRSGYISTGIGHAV